MFLAFLRGLPHESAWAFSAHTPRKGATEGEGDGGRALKEFASTAHLSTNVPIPSENFRVAAILWFSHDQTLSVSSESPLQCRNALLFLAYFFDLIWMKPYRRLPESLFFVFPFSVKAGNKQQLPFFWVGSLQIFIISLCFWFIQIMVWRHVRIINHKE